MPASIAPAWIQAVAAIVSLGVTWWLARLTARYVRTTEDIANTSRSQVEQALALARSNQIGAARALLEESRRIRSELGELPDQSIPPMVGGSGIVPTIHPWFHSVIPTIAQTDSEIVGLFLKLDRSLHNHGVMMNGLAKAEESAAVANERLKRAEDLHHDVSTALAVGLEKELEDFVRVRGEASVAERNLLQAQSTAEVTYAGCIQTLDTIASRLAMILKSGTAPQAIPTRAA
jgi:hypothetical protein